MSRRLCLHPTVSARASAIVIRHAIKLMRRSWPATTRAPVGRRAGMCHGSDRAVPPCRAAQCANRQNPRQLRRRLIQTRACAMGRAGASVRRRFPRESGESERPRSAAYTMPSRLWLPCGGDAVGRNGTGDARALAPPGLFGAEDRVESRRRVARRAAGDDLLNQLDRSGGLSRDSRDEPCAAAQMTRRDGAGAPVSQTRKSAYISVRTG